MKQVLCILIIVLLNFSNCFSFYSDCSSFTKPLPESRVNTLMENLNVGFYMSDSLKQQARQAYCYSIKYNIDVLKAMACNHLGFEQYVKANRDSANLYLNEAHEILSAKPASVVFIRTLKLMGLVSLLEQDIISAKKHFDETENLSKVLKIDTELAEAYNNKGLMYMQFREHPKAQTNLRKAIDQFKIFDDKVNLGYANLNLAKSLYYQNMEEVNMDTILYFTKQAEQTWKAIKNQRGLAYYNTFMGDIYKYKKDEISFAYFKKAISINEKNNFAIELPLLYYNCALYYLEKQLFEQSLEYTLKSVDAAIEKKDFNSIRNGHDLITKYLTFNTIDEAFAYHSKISAFLLNIPDYSHDALTEILETELKSEETASKNEELTKKNYLSNLINYVLFGSLLILSTLLFIIWRLWQQRIQSLQALKRLNEKVTTQNERLINTQKLLTQSIEKLQSFAHVVSHDLKAPLRTINGFAKVAIKENKQENKPLETSMLQIINLSNDLTNLVDDILADATDKKKTALTRVDLNIVVNKVLSNLKYDIEKNDVRIIQNELPITAGKENQLVQLFQNIISNAIAYKDANRKLVLKLNHTKNKENLAVSIKDNGKGIRNELLTNIFNKNNRGDEKGKSGTGLGLYTCQKIMQELQGTIQVESKVGIGSEFILLFPVRRMGTNSLA